MFPAPDWTIPVPENAGNWPFPAPENANQGKRSFVLNVKFWFLSSTQKTRAKNGGQKAPMEDGCEGMIICTIFFDSVA